MPYIAQIWTDDNPATPLSGPRMTTMENGIASSYVTYNVKDSTYGAVGDGVTDDTAAVQAAINALPTSGTTVGGVVYFPPGYYKLTAPLTSRVANLALVGADNAHGMWPKVATPNTVIFTPSGGGFQFNVAGPSTVFGGPTFKNLCFSPVYTTLTSTQTLGSTLAVSSTTITRMPSSGTAILQDRNGVGVFSYSAKSSNHLTGITVLSETVPGFSYQNVSAVTIPSPYGVRISRATDFHVDRCTFMHYNDTSASIVLDDGIHTLGGATGLVIDGSSNVAQYGACTHSRFFGCYRGAQEYSSSTTWIGGDFDGSLNGATPITGSIGWYGQLSNPCTFHGTKFHGSDILQKTDGGAMVGCRYETWITAAVSLVGATHVTVMPGSMNNFQGGAGGIGISLDAATTFCTVFQSPITSVATRVSNSGSNNTLVGA